MLELAPPAVIRLISRFDDMLHVGHAPSALAMLQAPRAFLARDPEIRLRATAWLARHHSETIIARSAVARAIRLARNKVDRFPESDTAEVIRAVVIKSRGGPHERGVLLVAFESGLAKVLGLRRFQALEDAYKIIFLPSSYSFFTDMALLLAARAGRPFGLMPSLFSEEPTCAQLGPLCDYLPFHAASWVNPDLYAPAATTKSIDLMMLASFARVKRHWRLFEALSRLPSSYRVVLVGFPLGGRNEHDLRREARAFGVEDRIEIMVDPGQEAIRRLLAQTKLLCAMSHREGSYISVAEALMAGVPVAAFANARFGTKAYINRQTGVLLDPKRDLAAQLRDAVEHHDQFAPAAWAQENISAKINCAKLDQVLAAQAAHRGEAWTRSIKSFYRIRFEFLYYDGAEAEADLADDYERIRRDFGLTIVRPIQEPDSLERRTPRVSQPV